MHDVIITDEEYLSESQTVAAVCETMDSAVSEYLEILSGVLDESGIVGETAEALRAYYRSAGKLKAALTKIANFESKVANQFLRQVDETDSFLY